MLRARGCKAERGAGSFWAERPLQPGLAPPCYPPTRPARGPAAPPLRPAPPRPPGTSPPLARRRAAPARAHGCRRRRRRRCHPHHVTRAPAGPAEGPSPSHGARARTRSPPVRTRERALGPGCARPRRRAGALCPQARDASRAREGAGILVLVPPAQSGSGLLPSRLGRAQGTGGGSRRRCARVSHAVVGRLRWLSALLPRRGCL